MCASYYYYYYWLGPKRRLTTSTYEIDAGSDLGRPLGPTPLALADVPAGGPCRCLPLSGTHKKGKERQAGSGWALTHILIRMRMQQQPKQPPKLKPWRALLIPTIGGPVSTPGSRAHEFWRVETGKMTSYRIIFQLDSNSVRWRASCTHPARIRLTCPSLEF